MATNSLFNHRRTGGLRVVGEFGDGLEAVQRAHELKPHQILLDIDLLSPNGIDAAHRMRQAVPGVKILFVSQNNDKDAVRAALGTGAHGYVLKTDVATELLPAVARVLGGDDFVSSGITSDEPGDNEKT